MLFEYPVIHLYKRIELLSNTRTGVRRNNLGCPPEQNTCTFFCVLFNESCKFMARRCARRHAFGSVKARDIINSATTYTLNWYIFVSMAEDLRQSDTQLNKTLYIFLYR